MTDWVSNHHPNPTQTLYQMGNRHKTATPGNDELPGGAEKVAEEISCPWVDVPCA